MKFSRKNLGVILIEFAFAIPIFLVLIYYLHDLPKMRLMQRKMQFVAHEIAAILQNIAYESNSPIRGLDVCRAMRLAYLSIYFGNTMNSTQFGGGYSLGHFPYVTLYHVKNDISGNFKRLWTIRSCGGFVHSYLSNHEAYKWALLRASVNPDASTAADFHPELENLKNGENKIVIDCSLSYPWNESNTFADGRKTDEVSRREAFGFLFVNPIGSGTLGQGFFPAVASFSPPPQAFSETSTPE